MPWRVPELLGFRGGSGHSQPRAGRASQRRWHRAFELDLASWAEFSTDTGKNIPVDATVRATACRSAWRTGSGGDTVGDIRDKAGWRVTGGQTAEAGGGSGGGARNAKQRSLYCIRWAQVSSMVSEQGRGQGSAVGRKPGAGSETGDGEAGCGRPGKMENHRNPGKRG